MTVKECSAFLKIGKTKTFELIASGKLAAVRFGPRCTRIKKSSVTALIA
jgi:excisionase family DNA binding protein